LPRGVPEDKNSGEKPEEDDKARGHSGSEEKDLKGSNDLLDKIFELAYDAVNSDQIIVLEAELLKDVVNSPTLRVSSPDLTADAIDRLERLLKHVQTNWECMRKVMHLISEKRSH
jgi:hypothetical protein